MDGVDALAEGFDRLIAKNHAMSAKAEGVDHGLRLTGTQEHDGASPGLEFAKCSKNTIAFVRAILQFGADDNDVGLDFLQERESAAGSDSASDYAHTIAAWPKGSFDQLAIHFVRFRDKAFPRAS
jgi:hypothetical protein